MRQDTDVMGHPEPWQEFETDEHPSLPQAPRTSPQERVRPKALRPHRKYVTPEEMWAWHWVRMRILLTWVLVSAVSIIVLTAGIVIFTELT